MANKKLKVEVELETAKAKRQAKELEGVGGEGISTVSPTADRASRQIRDLGRAAEGTQVNMKAAGKAFAGMAVGLAAGYAAKNMKPGSARDAVEYGGGAIQGAAMGMMFGPIGAAIGALGGTLKTYLDKSAERKDLIKDYNLGEAIYKASRAQMDKFNALTDPRKNGGDISGNIPEMKRISENFKKSTETLLKLIDEELKKSSPDKERISNLKRNVDWARNMADRYDKAIEDVELKPTTSPRVSMTGTDALAKVGGFSTPSMKAAAMSFSGPSSETVSKAIQSATERSAKHTQEMVDTLKEIAQNTKGGETWQ